MAYRSRNQDRDQEIARRISDSYKYAKRPKQHQPDPAALAILRQYPDMTWEEAIDEVIKAELAEREMRQTAIDSKDPAAAGRRAAKASGE
jgi:hypothetical protein